MSFPFKSIVTRLVSSSRAVPFPSQEHIAIQACSQCPIRTPTQYVCCISAVPAGNSGESRHRAQFPQCGPIPFLRRTRTRRLSSQNTVNVADSNAWGASARCQVSATRPQTAANQLRIGSHLLLPGTLDPSFTGCA
eukprot:2216306-Rhodomonas_salina.3